METPHETMPNEQGYASGGLGHVVPVRVLMAVWLTLLTLTLLTVEATHVNLGQFNVWLAMLIAGVKASLVLLYFMHLRYDSPFHGIIIIAALLFVAVFISISSLDAEQYQETFEPPPGLTVAP